MRLLLTIALCVAAASAALAQKPQPGPGEKRVEAADLVLAPKKYAGVALMVPEFRCYYANVEDYRCIAVRAHPALAVFTKSIVDDFIRKQIEATCDTIKVAMVSNKCRLILHFTFSVDQIDEDIISGFQQRVILRPSKIEIKYRMQ